MDVRRWATGAEFLERAEPFLAAHEVENTVPLGIANQLRLYPQRVSRPPYLATAEQGGQIVGAAVMTPPMRLLLAYTESRPAVNSLAADVASFDPTTAGVSGAATQVP